MNYQHIFHSGNFADVCKHVSLLLLLQHFTQKETPFCYLETHAGAGDYALNDPAAKRSEESQDGIARLWQAATLPEELQAYKTLLQQFNPRGHLTCSPGSPLFAQTQLRPQDRAVLAELEPNAAAQLKQLFAHEKQIAVHQMDGYHALKAFTPPAEKRGLLFIDPPYETGQDQKQLLLSLQHIYKHWRQGCVAIWHPIKHYQDTRQLYQQLKQLAIPKLLATECCVVPPDNTLRLNGSGLIVLNPPWHFTTQVQSALNALLPYLSQSKHSSVKVMWLVGESV